MSFDIFIKGVPYCQAKVRGNLLASKVWSETIIEATSNLPKIKFACSLDITFFLPKNKYPADHPYGPDLDNLLKRLFDALNETVLSEAKGKDGAIIKIVVTKKQVTENQETGALIIFNELTDSQ